MDNAEPPRASRVFDSANREQVYEELDRFFNLSLDLLCIAGLDGRFKYLNPAWEQTLGYSESALLSRPYLDFVHPDDRESTLRQAQKLGTGTKTISFENRYQCSNGSYRWFLWNATPALDKELVYAVAHDITDLKRAQEILVQAKEETAWRKSEERFLELAKLEAVGRLAGGIAHDFNNLLSVINGRAELLLEKMAPQDKLRQDVTEISEAGARAASLTRQLLAFSRKQVLESKVADLNPVLAEMGDLVQRLIGEDIRLEMRLGPSPGRVKVDTGQIGQVVMNLAVNARDAMPRGGQLLIETANVSMDHDYPGQRPEMPPGPYVVLTVSDTGEGMHQTVQERIFEPFFTTKEMGKGTGMGLATVYGIVKQSGGFIWVYSEPGQGATFKIYFPSLLFEEVGDPVRETVSEMTPGSGTILLVEDDYALRRLACEFLKGAGYRVLDADSARAALEIAAKNPSETIDLLLTDVVLPDVNGTELAAQLAGLRPGIKTLYVSGYTDNAIMDRGILSPGHAFLQKPYTKRDFLQKIENLLGQGPVDFSI